MPLPLPNLDTRRWSELVDQGRGMVPQLAPAWTDHNIHDPGITLLELGAWLTAEEQGFRANRISDRHRLKFLGLAGLVPRGAQSASVLLGFATSGAPRDIPAGVTLDTAFGGRPTPFAVASMLCVSAVALASVKSFDGRRMSDVGRQVTQIIPVAAFGDDPLYGAGEAPALYLGFDAPLPVSRTTTLWLVVNDGDASYEDSPTRCALAQEARRHRASCRPTAPACPPRTGRIDPWCEEPAAATPAPASGASAPVPRHHSVRATWEVRRGGKWVALAPGEIDDRTRALTLNGAVRITPQAGMEASVVGDDAKALYYLRCRVSEGRHDAAPLLRFVGLHAVRAEQRWLLRGTVPIAAAVTPPAGAAPGVGATGALHLRLDAAEEAVELALSSAGNGPRVLVLDYQAAGAGTKGSITATLSRAGSGDGWPTQEVRLAHEPFGADRAEVWIDSEAGLAQWDMRPDLDASTPIARDFSLRDGQTAAFGDGARGRVIAPGRAIFSLGSVTLGTAGNVAAGAAWRLAGADDAINRALLGGSPGTLETSLGPVRNALPARGGEAREDLRHAMGRALESLWAHERLVELAEANASDTLDQVERTAVLALAPPARASNTLDLERIALATPGTAIARARAFADFDPAYPCLHAPGSVALFVLPHLPSARPDPSEGLLEAVRRYLEPRRVLGMRLTVGRPRYAAIKVRARLKLARGSDRDAVLAAAAAKLDAFFHPLRGGERGRGWPFGRDVYRSEVMQILADTAGVDALAALELVGPDGVARCGNLCIGEGSLVACEPHELTADD
jgi:hypothetical protein